MSNFFCFLSPTSCVSSIAKSTFGDLFNALTGWVLDCVQWLLSSAAAVLNSASDASTVLKGAQGEFSTLLVLSPPLMMIGLLVATLQALRHGEPSTLWRVYLGVMPACVAGIALARPLAQLILEAVNAMSTTAAGSAAANEGALGSQLNTLAPTLPGFGLFLLTCTLVVATWLLWCELIVRNVVLTLALVLVPIVVALSTFPSLRRLGWRLGELFVAVASSKLVIVVTLALGFGEFEGSGTTEIVSGAVTLILATATPFLILRLVPFLEQSALHSLDGLRARATRRVAALPSSPLVEAGRNLIPPPPPPPPPERTEDLGLDMWPGDVTHQVPEYHGDRPKPPVGTPLLRGGHVVYRHDEGGPVVGWHFDE